MSLLMGFEPLQYNQQMVNEAVTSGNGTVKIKGVFQRAGAKNQNGRIYPKEILHREAASYMTFVNERRALGELDHPESTVVNLKNVSHNVTKIWWEGDNLLGEMEILSTPSGNIVKELMRNGIRLGVSSRGLGSVHQVAEGVVEVEDDFNLICFDIVSNPSTQGAFLSEGVNSALAKARIDRLNGLVVDFFSELGA